jgi:hypothetical protein
MSSLEKRVIYVKNFPKIINRDTIMNIICSQVCRGFEIFYFNVAIYENDESPTAIIGLKDESDAESIISIFTKDSYSIIGSNKPLEVGYYRFKKILKKDSTSEKINKEIPRKDVNMPGKDLKGIPRKEIYTNPREDFDSNPGKDLNVIPEKDVSVILYNHDGEVQMLIKKIWTGEELIKAISKRFKIKEKFEVLFGAKVINPKDILGQLKFRKYCIEENSRIMCTGSIKFI